MVHADPNLNDAAILHGADVGLGVGFGVGPCVGPCVGFWVGPWVGPWVGGVVGGTVAEPHGAGHTDDARVTEIPGRLAPDVVGKVTMAPAFTRAPTGSWGSKLVTL